MVLAKYGKISDVQAAGLAVIAILKRLFQLSGKTMTAIRKNYDSYHEKAIPAIRKSCLFWAEANEVRRVILDCWRGHFNIYFMDLTEKW